MSVESANNWKYLSGALSLHVLFALLLFGVSLTQRKVIEPQLSITGVMVNQADFKKLMRQTQAKPTPQPAPVVEPTPQPEQPPQPDPAEVERQRQAQEAERLRQEQERQEWLQQQQEQARLKATAEKQKQLEAQRKAAEAEAKRQQQAAEQKRLADIKEKQRQAELQRQAAADAKAQQAREAELAAQLAAEEGRANAVNAGLLNQYVALISQKVQRYWIKPPTAKAGLECEVKVTQAVGGTVLGVSVGRCNGDQAVRASIETAVNAASPLPAPPDARLFDRNLTFIFKPTE